MQNGASFPLLFLSVDAHAVNVAVIAVCGRQTLMHWHQPSTRPICRVYCLHQSHWTRPMSLTVSLAPASASIFPTSLGSFSYCLVLLLILVAFLQTPAVFRDTLLAMWSSCGSKRVEIMIDVRLFTDAVVYSLRCIVMYQCCQMWSERVQFVTHAAGDDDCRWSLVLSQWCDW